MNRLRNFLAAYRLYRRWNPLRVAGCPLTNMN